MKTPFKFKQFSIDDNRCAHKVGTDSILLGSWVKLEAVHSILDVGAGSGLLSLMMAQKYPESKIVSIEIESEAIAQCTENIKKSPFNNIFELLEGDFLSYSFNRKFDLVISNPPYFEEAVKPLIHSRKIARHQEVLPLEKFIPKVLNLLNPKGKLVLVLPFQKLTHFKQIVSQHMLFLTKVCSVSSFANKPPKLVILELSKEEMKVEYQSLAIYKEKNQYSQIFKALTKEFYLDK